MKLLFIFLLFIIIQHCSFDNKSGIWSNDQNQSDSIDKNIIFKDFKTLIPDERSFNKIINLEKNFKFFLPNLVNNLNWNDKFYNYDNNLKNFKYKNINKQIFKSKKISKFKINDTILYVNENAILSDNKGNIIIYSIKENKINYKFNFYKGRFKKISKSLNIILEKNIIYVSDNIGFLYAFDLENKSIKWAKNYKIPFRSNLKIQNEKLIAVNQNNEFIFFNKNSGEILKSLPTEDNIIKNEFKNILSLNKGNVFLINTYGSLYSIDSKSMQMNWFSNFNQSLSINPSNLFKGNLLINNEEKIILTSNNNTYIVNMNGVILTKKNFSYKINPILLKNYLFLITKNDLLISMDINSGKIIYSYNINQKISEYLNIKEKRVKFKKLLIANNKILIFLSNSYLLIFNIDGSLENVKKLPSKIQSNPIIVNETILYLSNNNKLSIVN